MRRIPVVVATLLALMLSLNAFAQSTTAQVRGKILNESGNTVPGAEVNAVNTASGFVQTVNASRDGSYQLTLPPGTYNIVVAAPGYQPTSQDMTVLVGQQLTLDLKLSATAVLSESITVVGNQAVETKTSEAATNVTRQQIENLPQNDRNFLNFAALAPGVTVSTDPTRKVIKSDAQDAERTNVFIDGISFKNDVLQGGVMGQDSSGGNPFPQNAVQEFRVITQNYSAQYDHASSAIITAVTKSGTNKTTGEAFVYYQPKAWVSETGGKVKNFQFGSITSNPAYKRYQPGLAIGGPIIKDRLQYFLSYEGVNSDATTRVTMPTSLAQFNGAFGSPFKSNLGFGKLSWQPGTNQLVDFSGTYRQEHETRDFGGTTAFEHGTDLRNGIRVVTVRHQLTGNNSVNQAALSYQTYEWNPTPLNPNLVGKNFFGQGLIGGNSTEQDFKQRRIELRDDWNLPTLKLAGDHNFQVGGNVDFMKYDVTKFQNGNPEFHFRNDPGQGDTYDVPFEVLFGFGNPNFSTSNREYGIYGQDSWAVNSHLGVTLGLRWDYESDQIDTSYVTPANIVAGLTGKIDSSYFSNGNNRSQFTGGWQPRLGFTYDVFADSKSVVFGGAGRYYDRIFLNSTFDERFRLQFPTYNVQFTTTGQAGEIPWDPKYYDPAQLKALVASGKAFPEIYLLNNNLKPPYSNQMNLGYRQTLGTWVASASYNIVRGYRNLTYLSATGICCSALVPGYGNVIISDPVGKRYWYDGIYLTADRPMTAQTRWGLRGTWTHATAKQTGNDLFSLDWPSAAEYGKHDVPGSEKDRLVLSGIFRLPFGLMFSTIGTFGSGQAANVLDFSKGFSLADRRQTLPFHRSIYPEKTFGPFATRNVDMALEYGLPSIAGANIRLRGEAFNVFNWANYGGACLSNFIPPEGNPNLGKPTCVLNLGRRFQAGVKIGF